MVPLPTYAELISVSLEIARKLLRKDGAIFVQIDHHEVGYLNVLMDEIFGAENKVQLISVKTASPAGFKTVNPGPIDVTEYILFYTKSKKDFKFKKQYVPVAYNSNYNLVLHRHKDVKKWTFSPIKDIVIKDAGFKDEKTAKKQYGNGWKVILQNMIEQYAFDHADDVISIRDPHKPTDAVKRLMEKSKSINYVLDYKREDGTTGYIYKGGALAFYSKKIQELDGEKTVTELLTDFWNHISWAGIAGEGGVRLKNGKKPEKLIKQILEMSTEPGDIILDYHAGSGTTCAVAHKMGRQYIGCEQLDYGDNDVVTRLKNVIEGDSTGISKAVKWKGGGSFICCEMKQLNNKYVKRIRDTKGAEDLNAIYDEIIQTPFVSHRVDTIDASAAQEDFNLLSVKDKKAVLMDLLDKNMLYVNLEDMEDSDFVISDDEKKFTTSFYRMEE